MIDAEFAFYGPMAFDVQKMIANLLIAYCASFGLETADGPRDRQRAWMLQVQMCRPTSACCWLAGSIMAGASAAAASGGSEAGGDGLAWLGAMGRQAHAATDLHSSRCACPLPTAPKHPLCNLLPCSQDGGVIVCMRDMQFVEKSPPLQRNSTDQAAADPDLVCRQPRTSGMASSRSLLNSGVTLWPVAGGATWLWTPCMAPKLQQAAPPCR